jgi:DNA-binding NarL/FixJ family response regulator
VSPEDDPRYRYSLETLLGHAPGFSLATGFAAARPLLDQAEQALLAGQTPPWDLVLMDLQLPTMSGIEATRRLKKLFPHVPVVTLTVFEEPATILEAITAGADGYLLKKISAAELLAQLRSMAGGGAPLTAGVARTVLELLRAQNAASVGGSAGPSRLDLTERELDVLQCLVRGLGYKQAADCLGISLDTVRTHIRNVYKKLQVHSVAEAVSRAIRQKLV